MSRAAERFQPEEFDVKAANATLRQQTCAEMLASIALSDSWSLPAVMSTAPGNQSAAENLPFLLRSFHELAGLDVGPRVVGERESDAIRDGRMVVEKEFVHRVWLGIAEVHIA